jgi:hypothetical protein
MTSVDESVGPVTVNLDGLWLLQALLGVRNLAPELRGRPYGAARDDQWLHTHPGVEVLRDAGLVDAHGEVVADLADTLGVLDVPDVEVVMLVARGPMGWGTESVQDPATWRAIPDEQLRVVLARRAGRWASAARSGTDITLDALPAEPALGSAAWLATAVLGLLDSAHPCEPSRFPPVNVPADQLLSAAAAGVDAGVAIRDLGVKGAAAAELAEVLAAPAAEAILYARVYDDAETRTSTGALDIRATPAGSVAIHQLTAVRGSDQDWMAIAPATHAQVQSGIKAVLATLNIASWESHSRF